MGLQIGDSARLVTQPPNTDTQFPRAQSLGTGGTGASQGPRTREGPGAVFFRQEIAPLRAGFGENSVSIPGQTIRALRNGAESSRAIQEKQEENRARAAERRAEEAREAPKEAEDRQTSPPRNETVPQFEIRSAAAVRAREYVQNLSRTAETASARLRGENPEPRVNPASVRVGAERFNLDRENLPQILDLRI